MDLVQASNILVMPFWLMMILLPRWRVSGKVMESILPVVPVAILYSVLVLPGVTAILPELMQPTTAGVAALLGSEVGATIAWIHFLAFDLFVGRWIYLDGRQRDLSAWIVSPVLSCTLMFGPFGLLLYVIVTRFSANAEPAS